MSELYVVATPIGNLEDISQRAIRILKSVDLILSEDTRKTKKLLDYYQIKTPLSSYHQHSSFPKIKFIIELLSQGKKIALVSEAGTPGISDPGPKLISLALEKLPSLKIIPIPGPSAFIAAISISGFFMNKFLFLGFPPSKRKRKKFFEELITSPYPVVFYESPYRILKTLKEIKENLKKNKKINFFPLVICRELTKKFETTYRGNIDKVIKEIEKEKIRGEFVVIVGKSLFPS